MTAPLLLGIALALLHAGLTAYLVWCIFSAGEPSWPMYWTVLMLIDFPLGLLLRRITTLVDALGIQKVSPSSRALDLRNFLLPLLVLGIGGTLWWLFLPQVLVSAAVSLAS